MGLTLACQTFDRARVGHLSCGNGSRDCRGNDDIYLACREFTYEFGRALQVSIGVALVDRERLAFDVSETLSNVGALPALKPGPYDLNLTRVTFPAQMPSNSPHHRSGAALYYIVSGTGANTVEGKLEAKTRGSLVYEPFGLVHQWGNPAAEPLTFLAFNINPEGVAAVLPGAPAKGQ
jgi:quercetin dioxygenase-like cupin family protein